MFNKWIIIALATVFGTIILMPEISASMANLALSKKHSHKSWAPEVAYTAAKINLRSWRFETAADLLERSIKASPTASWAPEAHFQYALAQEKLDNNDVALKAYRLYASKYPRHHWKEQARKRVSNIQVNSL